MGIVLMSGLAAGGIVGLIATALGLGVAVPGVAFNARRRRCAWIVGSTTAVLLTGVLWAGVTVWPQPAMRPGSDYDVALANLFARALMYTAAPGIAAVAALVATLL